MNEKLLDIICCPATHQPLKKADQSILATVNDRVAAGELTNEAGRPVTEKLSEALVTHDGRRLYAIHDGMPALLVDESIVLERSG